MRAPGHDVLMLCSAPSAWSRMVSLVLENHRVQQTSDIKAARAALGQAALRLVLIGDDLREARGLTVLRAFVSHWRGPSVLLDRSEETGEAVVALEGGFDDVWSHRLDPRLVLARARVLMRQPLRPAGVAPTRIGANGLDLDRERRTLRYGEREVTLSARECDVMMLLIQSKGRVVERHTAVAPNAPFELIPPESLDQAVMRLRRRLADLGAIDVSLLTVRGEGFLLRSND